MLQGTVSVVEEEGKAGRQELSAIVEAEIKTRLGSGIHVHVAIIIERDLLHVHVAT